MMTRKHLALGLVLAALGGCATEPTPAEVEAKLQEAIGWYTGEAGYVLDQRARQLLTETVNLNYPLPQMWIARCYSRGRMTYEQDSTKARLMAEEVIDRVRQIAEEGSVEAIFLMGSAYDEGLGVPVDSVVAIEWFLKAGDQGHTLAQHNLGNAYFAGRGVPQNDSLAAAWWRKAAEKGDAIAQYRLGSMYEEGRGVPQNDSLAVVWYLNAAGRGDRRAQQALEAWEERGS